MYYLLYNRKDGGQKFRPTHLYLHCGSIARNNFFAHVVKITYRLYVIINTRQKKIQDKFLSFNYHESIDEIFLQAKVSSCTVY